MSKAEEILSQYFGYSEFRPLQKEIVESIAGGHDTIALLPTGGGKSICFQVPALMMEGICIVVTPLIALMKDQVENLANRDIKAIALYGGMSRKEIEFELENCINGKYKFLYVSPERLQSKNFVDYAVNMKVSFLAIDEAHCISQWGYDFRPPYLKIAEFKDRFKGLKTIALTASATPDVIKDIALKLELKNHNTFSKSFERSNLTYVVEASENKLERIATICSKVKGTGLVYVKSRKKAVEIAKYLVDSKISSDYYHAGLDAKLRTQKQDDWKNNRTRVMVCTNAFGMGIDKPEVRFVIHEQKPDTMEAYYQEAGRAGRDGKRSYCVLLYHPGDFAEDLRQIESKYPAPKEISRIYELMHNYLNIAVGSGKGQNYNFDLHEFSTYFNLSPSLAYNAVKILENESYFQTTDAVYLPSRMKIIVDYNTLYEWQLKHESVDALFKVILRSYGGVFDFYTNVFEFEIARRLKQPERWVKEQLSKLHDIGLIDYIPQNNKPQVMMYEDRFSSIYVSNEKIEFLRDRYKEKLEFMNGYVKNKTKCRSNYLVEYFGEHPFNECGVCDVCSEQNRKQSIANDPEIHYRTLKDLLESKSLKLSDLKNEFKGSEINDYLIALRWMIDNGDVQEQEDGYLKWKKIKS